MADERRALLQRVNVVIVPRANPDAAETFARTAANGIDINRDHLLLRTPELLAITAAVLRYAPQVMLDLHATMVAGLWARKFGGLLRADLLLQGGVRVDRLPITVLPALGAPLLGMDVLGKLSFSQSGGVLRLRPAAD